MRTRRFRPKPATNTDQLTADAEPIALPILRETVSQHPEIIAPNSPDAIDRSAMFLTYLAFMGDIHRTAAALMTDPAKVKSAAEFERWDVKVKHLKQVQSDLGPDEFLRELNRVVNFVQAVRLRSIMDNVLKRLQGEDSQLDDFLRTDTKDVSNRTAKSLLDVIKCCEAVHRLTYTALGDLPSKRTLDSGDSAKGSVALGILSALGSATPSKTCVETTPAPKLVQDVDIAPLKSDTDKATSTVVEPPLHL